MKKMIPKHIALLAALLLPLLLSARTVITHSLSYNYGANLTLGTDTLGGVTYSTVTYDGLYNGGDAGMPSLPVDYLKFSVPYDACDFSVTASASNILLTNISHMVYPCQPPRLMNDTTPLVIVPPDSAAYHASSGYPVQRAWVVDEGFLAGENHIVTVAVMPVAFRRTSTVNSLRQARNVTVRLSYERGGTTTYSPIVRNDSTLRAEGYELTRSMVVNPGSVSGNAPLSPTVMDSLAANPSGTGEGLNGWGDFTPVIIEDSTMIDPNSGLLPGPDDRYHYLIITTSELSHSVRRIAALKQQKGYKVKVATLDEVYQSPYSQPGDVITTDQTSFVAFADEPGKLRQFIRNFYKYHGTKYVLLAGKDIPCRIRGWNMIGGGESDFYYCELNGDWSPSSHTLERNPEVFVGRLLCSFPEQVDYYTNKLYRYELNPGNGDYSYLRRALFTEGRDYLHDLDSHMDRTKSFFPYQTAIRDSMEVGDYPKGCDVIDSINSLKYGFMTTLNHGSPSSIKVYGEDPNNKRHFLWAIDSIKVLYGVVDTLEVNNGLNRLQNKYHPMILYSLGCQTMPYHKIEGIEVEKNFGESFTLGENYGGPAYLGYTTEIFEVAPAQLMIKFIDQLYLQHYKIGMAEAMSKFKFNGGGCEAVSAYHNLLGDPSVEIWTNDLSTHYNLTITRTDSTISISSGGRLIPYLAYCANDGSAGLKSVMNMSCTLTDISPNSSIMLFSHSTIPYIAPLYLQNIMMNKSQYVIASDITAGNSVDRNRARGDVVIKSGIEYEIEATGDVRLEDGFRVEPGAMFAVYPSSF